MAVEIHDKLLERAKSLVIAFWGLAEESRHQMEGKLSCTWTKGSALGRLAETLKDWERDFKKDNIRFIRLLLLDSCSTSGHLVEIKL